MLPGVDAGVDVLAGILRIGIRIVKDYGPGVPDFDNMTPMTSKASTNTSINTPQAEKESFKPAIWLSSSVEQAIPRDFVEYGSQMAGPVIIKN
ncbi:hypothetical protein CNYM01_12294 [Colletotrichum nymphaeae SA-01]|uniref:Uncharacterized protein n=1 Tax=Colletotrichum nymphaeae SA-01 TaxID=1460502 RepID=A0A135UGE6_9PEZI|nr:hypothetical protein CNYM01_12294 [Colletotrichum nymphaeae SA-01]